MPTFPSIAKYNHTLQTKGNSAFKTLVSLDFIPSRTAPVKIYSFGCGSYAVVFKARDASKAYAIRCFISADRENIDRYKLISKRLSTIKAEWVTNVELLEEEIHIEGHWYPVIKMDWIEGQLLNQYIDQTNFATNKLTELQHVFLKTAHNLEANNIGHGDIQCGNVIVQENLSGSPVVKLIDYDGMYIPELQDRSNLERGRAEFQHPTRGHRNFNEKIDRFSFWIIITALEALKFDRSLWKPVMEGGFNTFDNLLFIGDDLKSFHSSRLIQRLYSVNEPSLNFYLDKLKSFCSSSPESVEKPVLYSGSVDTTDYTSMLTGSSSEKIEVISTPPGAAVLNSSFERLGTTPLQLNKLEFLHKTLLVSYGTQVKQLRIDDTNHVINVHFPANNTRVNTTHANQPQADATAEPKLQEKTSNNSNKESSTGVIMFIMALVAVIVVAVALMINQQRSETSLNSLADTLTTTYSDYNENAPLVDTMVLLTDTTTDVTETLELEKTNAPFFNPLDDFNHSAEEVLIKFLDALNNGNCNVAWTLTLNPIWERKGNDWFCSVEAFGSITKVIQIEEPQILSNDSESAVIAARYYAEDWYNGNKCYDQKFFLNKVAFDDGIRWAITRMINISSPTDCTF